MPITGENPIVALNESTPISAKLVFSLLVLAAAVGSAHWRLQSVERKADTVEAVTAAQRDMIGSATHSQDLRLQRLEDNYIRIETSLSAIEKKLEDMRPHR